jgi:hypothetical protein
MPSLSVRKRPLAILRWLMSTYSAEHPTSLISASLDPARMTLAISRIRTILWSVGTPATMRS